MPIEIALLAPAPVVALAPTATELSPCAVALSPKAAEELPDALLLVPTAVPEAPAVDSLPTAVAFTPSLTVADRPIAIAPADDELSEFTVADCPIAIAPCAEVAVPDVSASVPIAMLLLLAALAPAPIAVAFNPCVVFMKLPPTAFGSIWTFWA